MPPWWLWILVCSSLAQAWLPPAALVLTPRHLPTRPRRQATPQRRMLEIQGWVTELVENRAFRAPHQDECMFYTGRVLGEPSYVALTECVGHIYGMIQVRGREYYLEPTDLPAGAHVLRRREATLDESGQAVAAYNLTGDTVQDLELNFDEDDEGEDLGAGPRHKVHDDQTEYFQDARTISRPLSGEQGLWLEMAVVADHSVVQFHGKARVRHYVLALMNIVSAIFSEPSLQANLTLVVSRLFLLEQESVVRPGLARKSLEAVNKWNYRHLMRLPPESGGGWDAAVWLTRAELGGPSGFAPVGGVCARARSAALDRDEGLTSAFVVAHELAHLLGLGHDGAGECDEEARRGSVMAATVLATLHDYTWSACSRKQFHEKSKSWYCMHGRSEDVGIPLGGASELNNYVFTMDEQCRTEFGEGYSTCTTVRLRSPCARLWCAHAAVPQLCRTKRAPPLDGTPCAPDHWCVGGYCEPISRKLSGGVKETEARSGLGASETERGAAQGASETHAARAGGWSEWGEWGECGAECGYSLRTRARACNNPTPEGGGESCAGAAEEAQVCWAGRECGAGGGGGRDVRSELCRHHNFTYIPYIHSNESEGCRAWCVDSRGGAPEVLGSLPDATPCGYEQPYNLCHQGSCVTGRCEPADPVCSWCPGGYCNNNTLLYSPRLYITSPTGHANAVFPQGSCVTGRCEPADPVCSWCPGGYCNNNTLLYSRRLRRGWTRLAIVPHEARRLDVHVVMPLRLRLALKERGKPALELAAHEALAPSSDHADPSAPVDPVAGAAGAVSARGGRLSGRVVAVGALLTWYNTDYEMALHSDAPLRSDLMILAAREQRAVLNLQEENPEVLVSVNYSTPAQRPQPYRWEPESGPCSAACGGGVRATRMRCRPPARCPPSAARATAVRLEPCNTHRCEWRWVAAEWEECSATCGEVGVQERMVYCVPTDARVSSTAELLAVFVSPALCSDSPPPVRQQPCNRLPCPFYWTEMAWTPCSARCGRGTSRRPMHCAATEEAACGPRPPERRRRCRVRRCPPAPCRAPDASQYCRLQQLGRACQLPPFRRLCCHACSDFENSSS